MEGKLSERGKVSVGYSNEDLQCLLFWILVVGEGGMVIHKTCHHGKIGR